MKKISIILFGALFLASCGGGKGPDSISGKVTATLENLPDSKVSLDWRLRTAWDDDDALCVFDHSAAPRRYNLESKSEMSDDAVQGKVWSVGTFTAASSSSLGDRNLDRLYAVAPWTGAESMASNGVISINMPERQYFNAGSFCKDAPFAGAGSGDDLMMRHVGGYIKVRIYGTDIKVAAVEIDSNGGEVLSGPASLTVGQDGIPNVSMKSGGKDYVFVDCFEAPVPIGKEKSLATEFWLVLPPVTLEKGITIFVIDDKNREFGASLSNPVTVRRGEHYDLPDLKVEFSETTPEQINAELTGDYRFTVQSIYDDKKIYNDVLHIGPATSGTGNVTISGNILDFGSATLSGSYDVATGKLLIPAGQEITSFYTDESHTKTAVVKAYMCDDKNYYSDDISFTMGQDHKLAFDYAENGLDILFAGFVDNQYYGDYDQVTIKSITFIPGSKSNLSSAGENAADKWSAVGVGNAGKSPAGAGQQQVGPLPAGYRPCRVTDAHREGAIERHGVQGLHRSKAHLYTR